MTFCKLLFAVFFLSMPLYAQKTYYYKQIKTVSKDGKVSVGRGGQFISFYKDVCYESNVRGETVGHGMLDQIKGSNGNYIEYEGQSYWGNVVFKFNVALNRLNIIKPNGTIIVYSKANAPSGVTTCSLIRNKSSNGSHSSSLSNSGNYMGNANNNFGGQADSQGNTNITRQKTKVTKKCAYCSGKGERIQHETVTTFGMNGPNVYCSKCNQTWSYGTVHAHHRCNYCNGTGVYEYEY
ncbi:MAG: hypothetical protein MSA28_03410 [Prevotella sp.]|nr:hypothetical protein [Prevotella sp.]